MPEVNRRALLRTGLAISATSLICDSFIARANALLSDYPDPASAEALAAVASREQLLFDFDWKFTLGSDSDPLRDLDFGKDQGDYYEGFGKTGGFDFATEKFDDSKWRSLNLPHDWAVELPFVNDKALKSHGYKPLGHKYPETSVGWYRRTFDIPVSDAGRRISIEFDGAFRSALVFLNGCFIGRNDNGYDPFSFDLTDFLNYGGKNILAVRLDVTFGDGWYYEGAGIYRHVWLTKIDSLHLGKWESYIRTDLKDTHATLSLGTVVVNEGKFSEHLSVHWRILDADDKIVAEAESSPPDPLAPGDSVPLTRQGLQLPSPKLWSPETPYLYTAVVSVETSGKPRDAERIAFGVRTVAFDADRGFLLNGKPVKIRGTCNHQDHAGVGAALPDRLQWYRLAILREMGGNAVRTSHNMPTPEWVEACDHLGMMMMCETRMMSSTTEGIAQLETMIKRYRNSPAIILWSMGNEEWIIQGKSIGEHIVASMVTHSHLLDPTRLCSAAINDEYGSGISLALDVEGINYNLDKIDAYHREHPRQPLIGTETGSTTSTRGVYITDKLRNWMPAYDTDHPAWSELDDYLAHRIPDPHAPGRLDRAREMLALHGDKKYCVALICPALFERQHFLRGMENTFCDFASNEHEVERLLEALCDNLVELIREWGQTKISGYYLTDDWGSQTGLMVSPALWKKYFRGHYRRIIDEIHRQGKDVIFHSCGNVMRLVPELIDLGVDILDPIQPKAMNLDEVGRQFGGKVAFCGGIDDQRLEDMTPQQVKDAVRHAIDVLGKPYGNAYILAPANTVTPSVPFENIQALFEACHEQ